jgi:hypothetical protein
MAEPVSTALGVKLVNLIAGFAGGVVSLAFVQGLTRFQAVMAVVVGALSANYLTPIAVDKLGIVQPDFQNGMAFVIGLTAMNLIPAIKLGVGKFVAERSGGVVDPIPPSEGGTK